MTITDDAAELGADTATPLGVALLGQLVRHLVEATHVLRFISVEVDLNLEEASSALVQASVEVNHAFEASTLLLQGAVLDENWSRKASRPKAVFARHNAAVAAGATRMYPDHVPMLVHRERCPVTDDQFPSKPPQASRPMCGHMAKTTGKPCGNHVVVLEEGVLASGCARHLPDVEKPSYQRQKDQTEALLKVAAEHDRAETVRTMTDATALWLRRQAHEFGMSWEDFCATVEITPDLTDQWQSVDDDGEHDSRWSPCPTCLPHIVDSIALVSVGMRFLRSWAAQQRPPRWASPAAGPPGGWLFDVPPKALAQRHELSLHMAVSAFAEVVTLSEDISDSVEMRHHEIVESLLDQLAHIDSICDSQKHPSQPTVAEPPPGARPANGKRSKKRRKR